MTAEPSWSRDRRTPLPPAALVDELPRARLVERLAARFDADVTLVVAGAGFGKTIALAQAMRSNATAPRGIDVWVSCEPTDEDASGLVGAIIGALDADPPAGSPIERLLEALHHVAPTDVCVIVDDVHELPSGSDAERLVQELAARLPRHAHLVIAGRSAPVVPLARRRAAGKVAEIGPSDLAFTPAEVSALWPGSSPVESQRLGGWPSLVRLRLSATPRANEQFLWEEIVERLPTPERSVLAALALLRSASSADVAAAASVPVEIVERVADTVPMVHRDAAGNVGAHQLWEDAIERILPPADVAAVRRRVLDVLADNGDVVRLGSEALRWGDASAFRSAAVLFVRDTLGAVPLGTAGAWLGRAPAALRGAPEFRLLSLAVRTARDRNDVIDSEIDAVADELLASGDADGHAVALALAAVAAHGRGDAVRLFDVSGRVRALPEVTAIPLLRFLVGSVDAALASLAGDADGVVSIIDELSFDGVPQLPQELLIRLHVVMLALSGDTTRAVTVARRLAGSDHPYVRSMPDMFTWMAGDPSTYLVTPPSPDLLLDVNHRDRIGLAAHHAVVAASLGDRVLADAARREIERRRTDRTDVRDHIAVAVARACLAVADHDDDRATDEIEGHLQRFPLDDALGALHLRRHPAVPYVVSAAVRGRWDATDLGPSQRIVVEIARQFLRARTGRLRGDETIRPVELLITSLPLAWTVELLVHASAAAVATADSRLDTIAAMLPTQVAAELAWLESNESFVHRADAARLRERCTADGRSTLSLRVLGPLLVLDGDRPMQAESGRGRVRTLLELLVLHGPASREWIGEAMWPGAAPQDAARNLRATLNRLRRLLGATDSRHHVRERLVADGDSVALGGPPLVVTDLDQMRQRLNDALHARRAGDASTEIAALTDVVGMWRGDPMADLDDVVELTGDVEHVRRLLADACLRLGELHFTAGRFDDAVACAERVRRSSPYDERAHRLLIASELHGGDDVGLERAVERARDALDEIGVDPQPTTQMVLRQAHERLASGRPGRGRIG